MKKPLDLEAIREDLKTHGQLSQDGGITIIRKECISALLEEVETLRQQLTLAQAELAASKERIRELRLDVGEWIEKWTEAGYEILALTEAIKKYRAALEGLRTLHNHTSYLCGDPVCKALLALIDEPEGQFAREDIWQMKFHDWKTHAERADVVVEAARRGKCRNDPDGEMSRLLAIYDGPATAPQKAGEGL